MKNSFKEVLKELDWSDGFRIPVANEENKKLEDEIEEKMRKRGELAEKLQIENSRIEAIDEHMKNLQVERDYNQNLLSAYISQYDAEENLNKIRENEIAAIKQQTRDIEKEKKNTEERIKSMEAEIVRLKKKIDSSKAAVAIDESHCLQWEETLNSGEERLQLIQNYLKDDGKKFKELDLKRQKLVDEVQQKKEIIKKTVDEITESEITLDRTAKFYAQVLDERRNLIDRWTQSIVVLRQRDSSIQAILREIESLKAVASEKQKLLAETEEFMEHQEECNRELKSDIVKAEKRLAMLKEKRSQMTSDNGLYEVQHRTQQQRLNEFSCKTEALQREIKNLEESNARKRTSISDANKRIHDLKETLRNVSKEGITNEERLKELESMLEKEDKRKQTILKDIKRFQDLIHRTTTQITELKNERKTIEMRKQAELKQIELSTIEYAKQEKLLAEKKEVLHQLDLQMHNYEMQLSSHREDTDPGELEKKKQMIKELEDILNDKKEVAKLLRTQNTNLETEIKKVQTSLNKNNQELETLKEKHQNLSFIIENSEKALKTAIKENEERQVEENILELRVTQAEEVLQNTDSKVHNLEQFNLQLHAAMQERMAEIKTLHEALNAKYKVVTNECSQLRAAITEKQTQTLNYQTRYDDVIAASQIHEAKRTAPTSTIELKIQNARNKSLLQERGDELDMTIRKTEQEIKCMENTLRIVTACNENYKISLNSGDDNDQRSQELIMEQLGEELSKARENMRAKKLLVEEKKKELLVLQENHKATMDELQELQEDKEKQLRDIAALEKQIADQTERISRADMRLKKLYKDIQKMCECDNADNIILQEKDIVTRELAELNLLGLQRITEFTVRHVEAEMYVKKLLAAKNIVLPGVQHFKSSLSLGTCDGSTTSSVASFSSRSKGKFSTKK